MKMELKQYIKLGGDTYERWKKIHPDVEPAGEATKEVAESGNYGSDTTPAYLFLGTGGRFFCVRKTFPDGYTEYFLPEETVEKPFPINHWFPCTKENVEEFIRRWPEMQWASGRLFRDDQRRSDGIYPEAYCVMGGVITCSTVGQLEGQKDRFYRFHFEHEAKPKEDCVVNPQGLSSEIIPKGWRLLREHEKKPKCAYYDRFGKWTLSETKNALPYIRYIVHESYVSVPDSPVVGVAPKHVAEGELFPLVIGESKMNLTEDQVRKLIDEKLNGSKPSFVKRGLSMSGNAALGLARVMVYEPWKKYAMPVLQFSSFVAMLGGLAYGAYVGVKNYDKIDIPFVDIVSQSDASPSDK